MSRIYDNWEKLIAAVVKREELWELFHAPSISISPRSSDFSCPSPLPDFPIDFSTSISPYPQNPISVAGESSRWENYIAKHSEVEHVVNFEKFAGISNPEDICVNNKPLDIRELVILQSCPNPPRKLKPGSYWYDKHAGFWGKQGHKPSQIISAKLNVGAPLEPSSSNGNTLVHINGREITKVELYMLKLAGVKCPWDTHIWMNEDGMYQEEAGVPLRGSIWSKPGMKLLCSALSLPFPSKPSHASGKPYVLNYSEQGNLKKFLLIGCSGSGTTTIFKQTKFLYKDVPFLEEDLKNIKMLIRSNLYGYICLLLEAHIQFAVDSLDELRNQSSGEQGFTGYSDADADTEKIIYSISPRLKEFSDWLLYEESLDIYSTSFIQQYAPVVVALWNSPAFQHTLKRASELEMLPTIANHFLQHAVDIFDPNYEPSRMDILCVEEFPSSLSRFSFTLPSDDPNENKDMLIRYQLISVPTDWFEDNYVWLEMFKHVQIVIFTVSLANYDKLVIDDKGFDVNKMMCDRNFFESVATHPSFDQTCFLLVLTEYDLFQEKLKHSSLNQCEWFQKFHPIADGAGKVLGNLGEMAFHYISVQFKILYASATGRKLYVTKVNCLDHDSVDEALTYAREVMKWNEEMNE